MRRFYVEEKKLASGRVALTGSDARHLRTVLRVRPGDEIFLFDGTGWDYRAQVVECTGRSMRLAVMERWHSESESPVAIALGQALLKGRKMDRVVRQVTELGITTFFPFVAQRSISRPDGRRGEDKRIRWQAVAEESLKQCGRYRTPDIEAPLSFEAVLQASGHYDRRILFHSDETKDGTTVVRAQGDPIRSVIALVGPEGGFTEDEADKALESGFSLVTFGPRILRADTAAVVCTTLLQHCFGDLRTKTGAFETVSPKTP